MSIGSVELDALIAAWERRDPEAISEILLALSIAERFSLGSELFNRRELDLLSSLFPPDFVHDMRPTGLPGLEVYRGPAEYRGFLNQWLEAFPDATLEREELEVADNVVFGLMRQTTHGRASGVPVDFRYAAVVVYRDRAPWRSWFDTDIERGRGRFRELAATTS